MGSTGSIVTLRNEIISPTSLNDFSCSISVEQDLHSIHNSDQPDESSQKQNNTGTLAKKDSGKDSESIVSSGMSSICQSPPLSSKRFSKYSDRYDVATLKLHQNSSFEEHSDADSMRSSCIRNYEHIASQLGKRSVSASLTNVR